MASDFGRSLIGKNAQTTGDVTLEVRPVDLVLGAVNVFAARRDRQGGSLHSLRGWVVGTAVLAASLLISSCSSGSGIASPSPEVSVSSTDGSLVVGEGSKLPDSWPPDVAAPSGLALQSVIDSGDSAVALYLGPGDAVEAGNDVKAKLLASGYDLQTDSMQGPARITTYLKDATQVQVSVEQTGSDASVTVTVVRLA